jgi:predicted sugar kinase
LASIIDLSTKESGMDTVYATLYERVDELIRSHKDEHSVLSTAGTQVAIAELVARSEGLEQALREIALEVERLSAQQDAATVQSASPSGD